MKNLGWFNNSVCDECRAICFYLIFVKLFSSNERHILEQYWFQTAYTVIQMRMNLRCHQLRLSLKTMFTGLVDHRLQWWSVLLCLKDDNKVKILWTRLKLTLESRRLSDHIFHSKSTITCGPCVRHPSDKLCMKTWAFSARSGRLTF